MNRVVGSRSRVASGLVLICSCMVLMARVPAAEVHYDVLVTSLSGTLVTGGYSHADGSAVAPLRVFKGDALGIGTTDPYQSEEEPGFEAANQAYLSGTAITPSGVYAALSASQALTFTFRPMTIGAATRNLFFWDGTGAVNFAPVTAAESLSLTRAGFGGWTRTITGTSAGVVNGATIETTDGAGEVHKHLTTTIASGGAGPATGFYLFAMQFQLSGLAPSADAYLVYGAYDTLSPPDLTAFEAAHDEALAWAAANLVVPEPMTGLLTAVTMTGLCLARRLRRGRRRGIAAAPHEGAR